MAVRSSSTFSHRQRAGKTQAARKHRPLKLRTSTPWEGDPTASVDVGQWEGTCGKLDRKS